MDKFYSFNKYLRNQFGERVHRISLDAGFSCPNLNGDLDDKGCLYCNNKAFVKYAETKKSLEEQIGDSIEFYSKRLGVKKYIAYFQAFSSTYADIGELKEKYDVIKKFPQIVGVCVSTRPDCINEEKIKLIASYAKDYLVWIEYGLQTTHDHILKKINRNHTYSDFLKAYLLSKKYMINVGVHMILGLPFATHHDMIEDAKRLSSLDIQGIKFHVLHVLANTGLEKIYSQKKVKVMSRKEYIAVVCDFLEKIPPNVAILRLVSTAFKDYLVAPFWINDKVKVIEGIRAELENRNSWQGRLYESSSC